jgi:glycosyltransferase involved in cell wall biosynthesis
VSAPVRYLVQALETWPILRRERPEVVFVQAPPIFCAVVAYLYAKLFRAKFVIDTHSSTFISKRWRRFLKLHRWLSRAAATTIVTNKRHADIVEGWGAKASILAFTPGDLPAGEGYPLFDGFNLAVTCSFDMDEPVENLLESAQILSDVNFHVTGDPNRLSDLVKDKKPENLHFTDYLPLGRYVGLLRGVDAVMDLTTWDDTLLMGAFEAVELEKPLITSNSEALREYFSVGTVHVDNSVEGICEGIRRAREELPSLQKEMAILRKQLNLDWETKFTDLERLLGET